MRHAFTTRNVQVPDQSVQLVARRRAVLAARRPLALRAAAAARGAGAHPDSLACKIEFELRYAFANGLLEAAISPVFDRIANTFVDSFVRRAEQVHGPR